MKVKVYAKPDGKVAIVYPVIKAKKEDETEEQFLERVCSKIEQNQIELSGLEKKVFDTTELPNSDRGAWKYLNGQVVIDQVELKKINDEKLILEEMKNIQEEKLRADAVASLTGKGKL